MNILIQNPFVLYPDGTVQQADLGITNDSIAFLGEMPENWKSDQIIDGKDKFAIPGFVNTHTHASMTLLRSYADDMQLMDWLENKIWPVEAKMEPDDIYWGAMLAAAEMIKTGTTTFADMYADMDKVADVAEISGLRAVLSRGLIGVAPNGPKALEENIALFKDRHHSADGRITVMLGPHAPYTCPPDFLKKVAAAAHEYGVEIHMHLSETKGEVENCLRDYGKSPIALMEECGILGCGVLAAHAVHLSADDIRLMKKYDVRVAHNPTSNMKLASGIAPVPELLKAGVTVGLGTDGASSNNNLDMLEEVNLAAMLHKVNTFDPLAIPAGKSLQMATEYGAKAVGLSQVGKIEAGYKADITLYDTKGLQWVPRHDLVSLLVYAANSGSVDTVIANGRVLLEKGKLQTLDEERIIFEVQRRAKNLVK